MKTKLRMIKGKITAVIAMVLASCMLTGCAAELIATYQFYQGLMKYKDYIVREINAVRNYLLQNDSADTATVADNSLLESLLTDPVTPAALLPGPYLLDVCPPYQTVDYSENLETEPYMINGKECYHGFQLLNKYNLYKAEADFNLEGKYTMLEFDIGHVDGMGLDKSEFYIYLDGELKKKIPVKGNMMMQHEKIPLNGAKQLIIKADDESINYAIVNAILY